jgi:hypothetical protein
LRSFHYPRVDDFDRLTVEGAPRGSAGVDQPIKLPLIRGETCGSELVFQPAVLARLTGNRFEPIVFPRECSTGVRISERHSNLLTLYRNPCLLFALIERLLFLMVAVETTVAPSPSPVGFVVRVVRMPPWIIRVRSRDRVLLPDSVDGSDPVVFIVADDGVLSGWRCLLEGDAVQAFTGHSHELVVAALELLAERGPLLGRPLVDTVNGSRHSNMKELRPGSAGRTELRALFAFDPQRKAIVLVAGDKQGQWRRWYTDNIPVADDRFDAHLQKLPKDAQHKKGRKER